MSDKFVVSTNDVGEIIVTDVETGNVYHYGSMSNFLGLIRLLNEQQSIIDEQKIAIDEMITDYKNLEKENERLKSELNDCGFYLYGMFGEMNSNPVVLKKYKELFDDE